MARTTRVPGQELLKQRFAKPATVLPDGSLQYHPDPKPEFLSRNNHHAIIEAEMRRAIRELTGCKGCKYFNMSSTKRYIRTPGISPPTIVLECNAVKLRKPDCPCQLNLQKRVYPEQRAFSLLKPILVTNMGYRNDILTEQDA